jgi:hypothetical protein
MVASESLVHRYTATQDWYDQGFLEGFIALVQHDAHIQRAGYKTDDKKIMMVMCPSPKSVIDEEHLLPYGDATHFVSPVYDSSHFAVLYYDLYECTVTVFDGLNMDIRRWEKHIIHTLKIYGIKPLDAKCNAIVTTSSTKDTNNKARIGRVMELAFQSALNPEQSWPDWIVINDPSIRQTDGYNCGPIACIKVMEVFGILELDSISTIANSPEGYRPVVMEYYQQCVMKYKDDLFFQLRKKTAKSQTLVSAPDEVPSEEDEGDDHTTVTRSLALEKRNKKQAASAEKEIRRCGQAAILNGAAPGAVVTLKVDYRTHSHAQGLIGVVFDVKPTGGIKVCCDHGIITHSGGPGVYWVHVDKYVVRAKPDEHIPLTDELYTVRCMVLEGRFREKSVPTISYAKLHQFMISASSPVKKAPGCKCKKGKCGKSCGCRKKKVSCHSGCTCNGNCCE